MDVAIAFGLIGNTAIVAVAAFVGGMVWGAGSSAVAAFRKQRRLARYRRYQARQRGLTGPELSVYRGFAGPPESMVRSAPAPIPAARPAPAPAARRVVPIQEARVASGELHGGAPVTNVADVLPLDIVERRPNESAPPAVSMVYDSGEYEFDDPHRTRLGHNTPARGKENGALSAGPR